MKLENQNNDKNTSDEIPLKELILKAGEWWRYLLSKWLIILFFGLVGGGLGFTYSFLKKTLYVANTTFVLEDGGTGGGLASLGGLASIAGLDIGGGNGGGIFQGDNILELYKSRKMIEKTLLTEIEFNGRTRLLVDCYIDMNNFRKSWAGKPELNGIQFNNKKPFNRVQDSILGTIVSEINKKYLKVEKPDKKLSIIKAEVKSTDEFFSKQFNEMIVKNVNDFYIQTKTKKSLENISILQKKADSVRRVMNGAIYSAAIATDETPNLNPTRQAQRIVPVQRSQFTAETNKAVLAELVKNLELSKISLLKETPLIQVVDSPIVPLNKERFGKLKGLVLGGILGGFITCLILVLRKIFKEILV